MSSIVATPVYFPHQHQDPRLCCSHPMSYNTPSSTGRKRKAEDEEPQADDRMSTSPSPSLHQRPLPAQRITKRLRPGTTGRPLPLSRLLETLDTDSLRTVLETICQRHPGLGAEIEQTAPRPSVPSALAVLKHYEAALQAAFPFGGNQTSDYAYNRVRPALTNLIEALTDFTPHFLPPNEPQATQSLSFLDGATDLIHRLPNWSTFQHRLHKQNAYEEISKAWTLVIQEAAKRAGGIHIQYGGWDQKLTKHNQQSGGKLQEAMDEMSKHLGWMGGPSTPQQHGGRGDDLRSVRQELLSGTYGSNLPVRVGPCNQKNSVPQANIVPTIVKAESSPSLYLLELSERRFYAEPRMAILPNLNAFIQVDGRRQEEYPDDDTEAENASPDFVPRYIECKSGATFVIHVELKKPPISFFKSDAIEVQVFFDGKKVHGEFIFRSDVPSHGGYCANISGTTRKIRDRWEFRPFIFKEIEQTEGASGSTTDKRSRKDLGSITIKTFHVITKGDAAPAWDLWGARALGQSAALPEQKLKGLNVTHSAIFGQQQISKGCNYVEREFVDGRDSPIATFQFRLCSKKALQSMLLVPRTPSPLPLEQRPIESLSVEEMHQLLRQYQSHTAGPEIRTKLESTIAEQRIKHEHGIKQEPGVKRGRDEETEEILASAYVKRAKRAETIDLSDE
ncbi:MAG: hypothetical protein Q9225_004585 [Loekoesia sp. 1 TL-2023]